MLIYFVDWDFLHYPIRFLRHVDWLYISQHIAFLSVNILRKGVFFWNSIGFLKDVSLLDMYQWVIFSNSLFIVSARVFKFLHFDATFVSSAKAKLKSVLDWKKSFIYIINSKQLRLDPWTRPISNISTKSEKVPFILTFCPCPVSKIQTTVMCCP